MVRMTVLTLALVCAVIAAAAEPACDVSTMREVWGYYFEPATGAVYSKACVKQPYTFENVKLFDFWLPSVPPKPLPPPVELSPFAFATAETAAAVAKIVAEIAPGSAPIVEERNPYPCPGGPEYFPIGAQDRVVICYTHPLRLIRVFPHLKNKVDGGKGYAISAGEAANTLMRNEQEGKRVILADIERGEAALKQ